MDAQNTSPQQVSQQPPATSPRKFTVHLLITTLVGLIMLVVGLGGGYFLFANKDVQPAQLDNQRVATVSPTRGLQLITPTGMTGISTKFGYSITLDELLSLTNPQIQWQSSKRTAEVGVDVSVNGISKEGSFVEQGQTGQPRNTVVLTQTGLSAITAHGWVEDINFAADGIDGSQQGYKITQDNSQRVLIFSFNNTSMRPDSESGFPVAKCPCTIQTKIFLSDPFPIKEQ